MTISVEHEGEDPKIIWSLDQSWVNEQKWYEGRVEVTPIEAAEKPKYRVGLFTSKLEYLFHICNLDCDGNSKGTK